MSHFSVVTILPADIDGSPREEVMKRAEQYRELPASRDTTAEDIPDEYLKWRVWDEEAGKSHEFDTEEEAQKARAELPGTEDPYFTNTESKWGWFLIGGRWSPFFKLKEGGVGKGKLGKPGAFGRDHEPEENEADIARKRHIDFGAMMDESEGRAREKAEKAKEIVAGLDDPKPIEHFKDKGDTDPFWEQPAIRRVFDAAFDYPLIDASTVFGLASDPENYVQTKRGQGIAPYGWLHEDGTWEAKGEMGWWGMSSGDDEQQMWNDRSREIIESVDGNQILVAVDFHV